MKKIAIFTVFFLSYIGSIGLAMANFDDKVRLCEKDKKTRVAVCCKKRSWDKSKWYLSEEKYKHIHDFFKDGCLLARCVKKNCNKNHIRENDDSEKKNCRKTCLKNRCKYSCSGNRCNKNCIKAICPQKCMKEAYQSVCSTGRCTKSSCISKRRVSKACPKRATASSGCRALFEGSACAFK